jgi:hypothetical protein
MIGRGDFRKIGDSMPDLTPAMTVPYGIGGLVIGLVVGILIVLASRKPSGGTG